MGAEEAELRDTIARLEEAQAFAERAADRLAGEVSELNRRLVEAVRRLDRLERRLEEMSAEPDGDDEPGTDGA